MFSGSQELKNLSEPSSTMYWSSAVHKDLLGKAEKADEAGAPIPKQTLIRTYHVLPILTSYF